MRAMRHRKALLVATGLIATTVAAIFIVMRTTEIGVFSAPSPTSTTTTANPVSTTSVSTTTAATVTTATPAKKLPAFNPDNEVESQAYFVSLWSSAKATQAEIKRQERVVEADPSVANQTNLIGLEQNCMSVVAHYNAGASTIASKAFRSIGLPPRIPPDECSP